MSRRGVLLVAVAALSLAAHAPGALAPLLDYHFHRQVNTASIARNYWREARPLHRPRVDWEGPEDRLAATELPIYMWLYGKLWPVLGLGERWGRLLSILASALTALLLFLLLERELGTEAGFYGAALFTVLPVEIYFGRTVQPEALALLGVASSLWWWDRALAPGRPWGAWAAAVASAALAIGLKLPYAFVVVPLAGLAWRRLGRAALADARVWAAGLCAAGLVAAWYLWARSGVYVVPTSARSLVALLELHRLPSFVKHLVLSRFVEIVATYGGLVLLWFGGRELLWRRRDPFWLAWFGGTALHLVALGYYAHAHEYTALPLALPAAGLMGAGLARLRAAAVRPGAKAALALLVVSIPVHAGLRIRHWYRQNHPFTARAAEAAGAVSRPEDLFYTSVRAPSLLLYYLDRRGWSEDLDPDPSRAEETLERHRRLGARYAASEKKGAFAEPDGAAWRLLRARGAPAWDDGALVIFRL